MTGREPFLTAFIGSNLEFRQNGLLAPGRKSDALGGPAQRVEGFSCTNHGTAFRNDRFLAHACSSAPATTVEPFPREIRPS